MKKQNVIKFILSIIIIFLIAYLAVFGLSIKGRTIVKSARGIKTGLDISGGVTIIYQANSDDESEITEEDLQKSVAVIRKRLEKVNIFDYIVRTDPQTSQIYIEIPTNTKDSSVDPLEAVKGLDKTAKVEFRDPDGKVLLSGDDIKSAKYSDEAVDSTGLPSPHVVLTFSDEGATKFTEATEKLIGKVMGIYLDDEVISEPIVNSRIDSNTAIITMGSSSSYADRKEEAQNLAILIDSGALPFNLNVISKEYVGPYIGQQALEVSIYAGMVALVVVFIIMLVVYKMQGLAADIALIAYVAIILLILSTTGISLTLPGIAGIILSIGMAVDANVIIFERFKEEMKAKVAPDRAFERAFKSSSSAIIDGNVTTFTVAILLYIFGMSSIKGFGILLAIGVVISLLTALVITKFLLKLLLPIVNKHPKLFALKKEVE